MQFATEQRQNIFLCCLHYVLVIIHRCSLFANNLPTQRTRSWLTWNDTIFKTKSQTQHKNLSNWNLYIVYMAIIDPDQAPSKFPIVSHTKSVSSLQELIAFCCSILIHKSNLTSWFCTSTSKLQSTHKLHQTDWTCLNLIARHVNVICFHKWHPTATVGRRKKFNRHAIFYMLIKIYEAQWYASAKLCDYAKTAGIESHLIRTQQETATFTSNEPHMPRWQTPIWATAPISITVGWLLH